jgi:hypothetical protein
MGCGSSKVNAKVKKSSRDINMPEFGTEKQWNNSRRLVRIIMRFADVKDRDNVDRQSLIRVEQKLMSAGSEPSNACLNTLEQMITSLEQPLGKASTKSNR